MIRLFVYEDLGVFCDMVCCTSAGVRQRVFDGGRRTKNGGCRVIIKDQSMFRNINTEGGGGRRIILMPKCACSDTIFMTNLAKLFDKMPRRRLIG